MTVVTMVGGPFDGREYGVSGWMDVMCPVPCPDNMGCFGWALYRRDTEETVVFIEQGWPEGHG